MAADQEILPCPGCHGECFVRSLPVSTFGNELPKYVDCPKCRYRGPLAGSTEAAIRLHNAMPREAEWIEVAAATDLPRGPERYDVAKSDGEFVYGLHRHVLAGGFCNQRTGRVIFDSGISHYRPHRAPKRPGAKP